MCLKTYYFKAKPSILRHFKENFKIKPSTGLLSFHVFVNDKFLFSINRDVKEIVAWSSCEDVKVAEESFTWKVTLTKLYKSEKFNLLECYHTTSKRKTQSSIDVLQFHRAWSIFGCEFVFLKNLQIISHSAAFTIM